MSLNYISKLYSQCIYQRKTLSSSYQRVSSNPPPSTTRHIVAETHEYFISRNLRTFAIANVHGKNSSWNNHVNIFAIDWTTQVINNYVYFCFLAQSSTASNFLDIDQEVQLFAIILTSTKVQFMKYSARQNGLNHACASNFPIHFLMGFLGGMFSNLSTLRYVRDIPDSG